MRLESEFLIIFTLGNMKMNKEKNTKTWRPKLENIDKLLLESLSTCCFGLIVQEKNIACIYALITQKKNIMRPNKMSGFLQLISTKNSQKKKHIQPLR